MTSTTPQPDVLMYTKPDEMCFGCRKTKEQFTKAGIPFTAIDVTLAENAHHKAQLVADGNLMMPFVQAYGEEWLGLNPKMIAATIKTHQERQAA